MSGRPAGLITVFAAVVALVVVTALTRPGLAGDAVAVPPPGPPATGDCVTDSFGDSTAASGFSPHLVYRQIPIERCTGARYAEVAAVIAVPAAAPEVSPPDDPYDPTSGVVGDDPNLDSCAASVSRYTELPPYGSVQTGGWTESVGDVSPVLLRPSARQEAAGQHWLACVVSPDEGPASFEYSLKDVYSSAFPAADSIGTCFSGGASRSAVTVWCGDIHGGELFGYRNDLDPADGLERSCRELVIRDTGLTDPTAGGALSVQVVTDEQALTTYCQLIVVNPSSTLMHSLRHLGNRPVPLR